MVKWTPELDGRFLSIVLKTLGVHVSGEHWTQIAFEMGEGLTDKACRYIFARKSSNMPVRWTKEVESRYLSVVLKQINARVSGEDWIQIAAKMGDEFTPKACT
ncbi:hypothetical protein PISL3812_06823 [Talaromyces islandicus]|uniref:Uncharacterized protein n=1 Tax=Talaromyces islandicus TaxID=28573 RepID=A0A0U1M2Q5_TALIS|nr:hypothetical protein PISL3812_06823 [Talaromyces islandicus]